MFMIDAPPGTGRRWRRSAALGMAALLTTTSTCLAAQEVVLAPELSVGGGVTLQQAIEQPWATPLSLTLHSGEKRVVHSCAELFPITKLIAPVTGPDLLTLTTDTARCIALRVVRDKKPADRSFVSDYRLDAAGWAISPPVFDFVTSLNAIDVIHKAEQHGQSAADLETVHITPTDSMHAHVQGDKWQGDFAILVRGLDLNQDGIEDLVVTRKVTPADGTQPSLVFMTVTRTKPNGPLQLVDGFPVEALGLKPPSAAPANAAAAPSAGGPPSRAASPTT